MTQLYPASSPDYTKNGIPLHPQKAVVTFQDKARWELDVTFPAGSDEFKRIDYGMHIMASVAPYTIPQINMGQISYWQIPSGSAAVPLYKTITQSVSYAEWDWTQPYQAGSKATCSGWGNYQCTQYDGGSDYIQVPPYNSSWWEKIPDRIPGQVITTLAAGTQLMKLKDFNSIYMVASTLNGQKGYIEKSKCVQVGSGSTPYVIPEKEIRQQPFEVRQIKKDQSGGCVVIHAVHDSYDLGGVLLGDCSMTDATPQTALEFVSGAMQRAYGGELVTNISDGTVTASWSWKNAQSALLDPKDGFVQAVNGYVYRDGKSIYIVPETDEGTPSYAVIYGVNMKSVIWTGDIDSLATRVYPVAKKADGADLMLPEMYIETVRDLPMIREKMIKVNAKVGQKIEQADGTSVTLTEADVLAQMRAEASACFTRDHWDEPVVKLDLDYEHMPDTTAYAQYQAIRNAEPHSWLLVRHGPLGIDTVIRMTGYQWDALQERYLKTSYGQQSTGSSIASYQLSSGAVTARVLASGSVGGDALQARAITAEKIQTRSITAVQMAAKTITAEVIASRAITAEELAAESVTAEKIKALAISAEKIAANAVTAEKIDASDLAAINAKLGTATIANGYINNAVIDYARIKAATTESLIARDAVTDRYFIDKLSVRNAQMVYATVGELVIKASDNKYYRLDVAADGSLSPTEVTLTSAEIEAGVTSSGHAAIIETDLTVGDLSATNMKGLSALIDKITASRIDVDELFARTATINALNAMDIRGNQYLRLAVNRTFSQWADPALTASNNVQDGDIWNKDHGIRKWSDFGAQQWSALDYPWSSFESGKQYIRKDGAWKQMNDPTGKYSIISGIEIIEPGVEISGRKYVRIRSGGSFLVDSGNFRIDESGNVYLSGTINATDGHFTGEITSGSGQIGGWTIGPDKLFSGSGANYVHAAASGDYAFMAGSSDELTAPFRVKRDGTVYLKKLITLTEQGGETTVDLQNYPFWKLYYHSIKSYTANSITLTNGAVINFNTAAQTYLDSEWVGNVFNYYVKDQNDQTILSGAVTLTPSPAQTGTQGNPLTNFNAQHKMAISVTATGIQGSPLFYWAIDASGEYQSGYDAGQNSVSVTKGTWNGGRISFSTSAGTGAPKTVELSQGSTSWSGNTATVPVTDTGAGTACTVSVDASARYTAGQNSVSVVKSAWSGGQATFSPSAGTGTSKTVQLSLVGSWSGNVYSYIIKDGQGSTGYTDTIDASARYTAGQNSVSVVKGTWSGGRITFSTSAGTGAGKTVELSQGSTSWSGNTATVPVTDTGAGTACTVSVDASARYTAGQNSVSVTKGTWSGGQISFSTSAGTGAGKTVQLSLAGSWSGNVYSYTIKDGQGSTGYTGTISAQSKYDAGYAAGWAAAKALIARSGNKIKGPSDTVDGEAVDLFTVTANGWVNSIVNNAPGYYTASGEAHAYIDGADVAAAGFTKTQKFG